MWQWQPQAVQRGAQIDVPLVQCQTHLIHFHGLARQRYFQYQILAASGGASALSHLCGAHRQLEQGHRAAEGRLEEQPHLQKYILGANGLAIRHCVLGTLTRLQYIGILTLLCLLPRLQRSRLRRFFLFQRRCHQVNFLFTTASAGCLLRIVSASTRRCCQTV